MNCFESLDALLPLAKFQLVEQFLADPRPEKVFVATGAYKDKQGQTPLLECVRIADERLHERGLPRDYLDPVGYRPFVAAIEELLFGCHWQLAASASVERHSNTRADELPVAPVLHTDRIPLHNVRTVHTPGGTAALRLAGDLLHRAAAQRTIWLSDPTWGNHQQVFHAAGLTVKTYPYPVVDGILDAPALFAALELIPRGDVLFLQASTHNPTCVDLSLEQWGRVGQIAAQRGLFPFFDVAFFGFTTGIAEDLAGMQRVLAAVPEAIVATSFSKSFALYNRRVGSLSIIGSTPAAADNAFMHLQHIVRANYSNPPIDGAVIVAEILSDRDLFHLWQAELRRMRERMESSRMALAKGLGAAGIPAGHVMHITRERGLFTCLNLDANQCATLSTDRAIYLSPPGRVNVTAIGDEQRDDFCRAVAKFLD